jgi:hypothetical protein
MSNFNKIYKSLLKEDEAPTSIIVKLQLNLDAVRRIEKGAEQDLKSLLETEINQNTDAFIEMLGYENW